MDWRLVGILALFVAVAMIVVKVVGAAIRESRDGGPRH